MPLVPVTLDGALMLVGAGKMGQALLKGWLAAGVDPAHLVVRDPALSDEARTLVTDNSLVTNAAFTGVAEVVVLAVKPQTAEVALREITPWISPQTLVISIMAGKSLAWLADFAPPHTPIVRAMPNMPAAVGRAMTVAVPNSHVTPEHRQRAISLLEAIGSVEWILHEGLMDGVTAVSGSGPAYVFLLAEALAKAGQQSGLPAKLAQRLAIETLTGSAELLRQSNQSAASLRESVTSPGGTTAAALSVLMADDAFEKLLSDAVAAATWRSRELNGV